MKKLLAALLFIISIMVNSYAEEDLKLYKKNVTASFYGTAFHGKQTSNGEIFDMNALTCAHKSLPFNTILKVTNLSNGKTVRVRVNDRGPFVVGREIDLSTAAAKKLDMITAGTIKVKLEIVKLGPNTKQSQQTAAKAKQMMTSIEEKTAKKTDTEKTQKKEYPACTKWDVQIGAYSTKENATIKAKELSNAGFKKIVFQKTGNIFRVALKEIDGSDIPRIEQELKENGFTDYVIRKRQ